MSDANMNIDISIRGPRSLIRTLDPDLKAVHESGISTSDLFESISNLVTPDIGRKTTWFNIAGSNYSAIKYMADFPNDIMVLVESTPGRIPFRSTLSLRQETMDRWPADVKKKLGVVSKPVGGSFNVDIDTKIDIPYMILAAVLKRCDNDEYRLRSGAPVFADNAIVSDTSEIYTARFPNLHYGSVYSEICWGTTFSESNRFTLPGVVQLPRMFLESFFNDHLCDIAWYLEALPLLARNEDEPFAPFSLNMTGKLGAWMLPQRYEVGSLIADMKTRRL